MIPLQNWDVAQLILAMFPCFILKEFPSFYVIFKKLCELRKEYRTHVKYGFHIPIDNICIFLHHTCMSLIKYSMWLAGWQNTKAASSYSCCLVQGCTTMGARLYNQEKTPHNSSTSRSLKRAEHY